MASGWESNKGARDVNVNPAFVTAPVVGLAVLVPYTWSLVGYVARGQSTDQE